MDDIAVDQDDVAADDCSGKFSDTAESSNLFAVSVDNEDWRMMDRGADYYATAG